MSTTDRATIKAEAVSDETLGQTLGRYKLLEKIGEGGFGVVYVAEQKEPVKRRVALKIIKLGMDTRQVVARFEAERQALALMDHPNIAKVLDAGATDSGRPYFVMELVRGVKLTDYCDQNKLSTKQRLELFIPVCQAIQHAHQKGIIHRDIKPSNILVTLHDGVPVPKVIDFGIAKATQQDLTDKTVYTQLQQFIGTPAYMSPEQAEMSGLDVDTRSDIYSLGVLLYELLTGSTPFDTRELVQSGVARRRAAAEEPIHDTERRIKHAFGEEGAVLGLARDALVRIDKSTKGEEDAEDRAILNQLKRQALSDLTCAALKLRRFTEAETSARALLAMPMLPGEFADVMNLAQPDDLGWAGVLLAEAQVGLGQRAEALKTLEPALSLYREMQVQGVIHVTFTQHLARALYVQAVAEPDDKDGTKQRGAVLEQALALIDGLSAEAKQLHDSKELLTSIQAEQTKASAMLRQ